MSVITAEQVMELESNSRFQNLTKQYTRDRSTYLVGQNGTAGNLAGLSPEDWAKQRYIAKGILLHPNSQNYGDWVSQFSMLLKGQDIWVAGTPGDPEAEPPVAEVTGANATIDAMIASQKFVELAELTFANRASVIEF